MIQDGSEAIDRVFVPLRVFEALGHRDAERARMVRLFREQRAAHARFGTRRGVHRGPVELHELSPLDLPIVDRTNPVDRRLEIREARRIRQGGPPLPRTRLGGQALVPFLFRVPGLGQCRVHLVAAGRAVELRLVVQVGRRPEPFLEASCPDQRSWPARLAVQFLHLRRNADPSLGGVLLPQALGEEEFGQRLQPRWPGFRILRWRQRFWQVRLDVVPFRRPFVVRKLHDGGVGLRHHSTKTRPCRVWLARANRASRCGYVPRDWSSTPCCSTTWTLPGGIARATSSIGTTKDAARRFATSSRSSFPGPRTTYRLARMVTAETGPPMILRWPSISTSPIAIRTRRSWREFRFPPMTNAPRGRNSPDSACFETCSGRTQ